MTTRTSLSFLSSALLALLLVCSCSPFTILRPEKPKGDPFSRVYAVPFKDFHPKLNQALQKYAKENPGNSFQVTRLGNDLVVIRGLYQKEPNLARSLVVITTRPITTEKTRLEIKPSSSHPFTSQASIQEAAGSLFQVIEKETGLTPAN